MVKRSRVIEINQFLDNEGFFPNAIIINIDTKNCNPLQFDKASSSEHDSNSELGVLHLPQSYKSAFVIDGQHRLLGYGNNQYRFTNTIPVVAFENLPSDIQAKLFVEINHKQKSVSSNLLKTLDAELKWNSTNADDAIRALKSKLTQLLNEKEESPLYNRIIMGEDKHTSLKCITLSYIFDYGLNKTAFFGELNRKILIKTGPLYAGDLADKTLDKSYRFFRLVFTLFEENLSDQWELGDAEGGFIARNIGVSSIIVIVWDIIEHLISKGNSFESKKADEIYDEVKPFLMALIEFLNKLSKEELLNMSKYWGSTGVTKIRREYQKALNDKYSDFQPQGLAQYIKESSGIFNDETRKNIIDIQKKINEIVFLKLKSEFGENYWRMGVNKEIQKACANKLIEEGVDEPPENFVELINYQKIISDNWKLLGEIFTQPDKHQAKKDDRLSWFVALNNIRKKGMHPERKDITEEEYEFIRNLKTWICSIG
jgi:DNA sulfur modification protein DndB